MSTPDFIAVYENALSPEACARLIERFEASSATRPGQIGGGVFPELKDSDDILISGRPQWEDAEDDLNEAVIEGLLRYLREYRYALIAPMMLQVPDETTGQLRRVRDEDFDGMPDAALEELLAAVLRPGTINLQRYRANQGGYPYWHCEHYPRHPDAETLHRTLLWTLYLNDGFDRGETEFLYQERRITPVTGSLLIAPAGFTHTHRGNTPRGADKFIATSWILFQRAEHLFGAAARPGH